ncbi:hypothetical protein BGLCM_1213 [Bifidobacterium gallicum DSM 20093 = LMG 11596]|nr:hypothetical protein BGLCM_1213 [Bifidobacterium gallicum DSM 20093 = LMG 11596]
MANSDLDPQALAKTMAIEAAQDPSYVGDFVTSRDEDGVTDFRFVSLMPGYEGWQWSVTMFHDEELDTWTVDESTMVPTQQALLPPKWVPWKDRLEPSDLSVTDAIGTEPDDERLEPGVTKSEEQADEHEGDSTQDVEEAVEAFDLSRRRVLSELGRAQTAKRWYEGPHGPKSLSTKTADGHVCSTCGFFLQLQGDLNTMFGVCANRWSPDDGRVVSLDHGCGEHSQIEPPEPSRLWVQTKPALDDLHIDIIAQNPREERGDVELMERLAEDEVQEAAQADVDMQKSDEEAVAQDEANLNATAEAVVLGQAEQRESEQVEAQQQLDIVLQEAQDAADRAAAEAQQAVALAEQIEAQAHSDQPDEQPQKVASEQAQHDNLTDNGEQGNQEAEQAEPQIENNGEPAEQGSEQAAQDAEPTEQAEPAEQEDAEPTQTDAEQTVEPDAEHSIDDAVQNQQTAPTQDAESAETEPSQA